MKKFRIVQYECGQLKYFKIQKKLFLGFWYNPRIIYPNTPRYYDTLQEASEALRRKPYKSTKLTKPKTIKTILYWQ